MPRILTKGSRSGVEDNHFDWGEEEELKSYNIAFYDLPDLVPRQNEFLHPWFDDDDAIHFPSRSDVTQFLGGGNDLVIRLPEENEVQLRGFDRDRNRADEDGNTIRYECDLLEWLPFGVALDGDEPGNDLVEVLDGFEDWNVCFSNGFEWSMIIDGVGQRALYGSDSAYTDPRPEDRDPGEPHIKTMASPSRYGPEVSEEQIAIENVNRTVASKVSILQKIDSGEVVESPGSVFLIPSHPEKEFDEFVQDILVDVFDLDIEEKPVWVSEYSVPGENHLRRELEDLESQVRQLEEKVERAEWFRQLLFANDEIDGFELEEPVRDAFREVGFDVDGEISGGRDGGIPLDDETLILEITGRRRGVKPHKIDKMDDHIQDSEAEGYCENGTGLLVYNAHRKKDPESRSLNPSNFTEKLDEYGYKFITSLQVYRMLSLYREGEIDTEDIKTNLTGDDLVIQFGDHPEKTGSAGFESRIDTLRSRLDDLL
ncbi:hypothetical protein [Haloarcula rubripromontorii]|uniref:hypothetical protein n=1 Tax=Haloarcula rubripromontorii TaxID=1705562 RepID=UPI00345B4DD4